MSVRDPDTWLWWASWAIIVVCSLLILTFSFGRDQAIYALVGEGILRGQLPYRDLWDFKPPGIFFVYALAEAMFGRGMLSVRLLEVGGLILTVFAFMRLSEIFFGKRQIGLLGGAVAALVQAELEFWHTAQPETFGGYLSIFALVLSTTAWRPRRRVWVWLGTGALFGLAVLLKPPLGGGAAVCAAFLAKREQERTDSHARGWLCAGVVGIGGLLPIALCTGWFALRGGWPALHWTLAEFTPGYTTLGWADQQAPGMFYYAIEEAFFKFSALAAAGVIAAVTITPIHGREREGIFLVLGMIAIQIAGVALQGKFFPYHYAAALLLIAFIAGIGLYKLWRRCLSGGLGGVLAFVSFVVVAVDMRTAAQDLPQYFRERALIRLRHALRLAPYTSRSSVDAELSYVADYNLVADRDVALEIRSRTHGSDKIFVWGFEPGIYWLAERPPASRFIYDVAQRCAWQRDYARAELMRDLRRNRPSLVVVQHNDVFPAVTGRTTDSHAELHDFAELEALITHDYVLVKRIEDFDLYERRVESLTSDAHS